MSNSPKTTKEMVTDALTSVDPKTPKPQSNKINVYHFFC